MEIKKGGLKRGANKKLCYFDWKQTSLTKDVQSGYICTRKRRAIVQVFLHSKGAHLWCLRLISDIVPSDRFCNARHASQRNLNAVRARKEPEERDFRPRDERLTMENDWEKGRRKREEKNEEPNRWKAAHTFTCSNFFTIRVLAPNCDSRWLTGCTDVPPMQRGCTDTSRLRRHSEFLRKERRNESYYCWENYTNSWYEPRNKMNTGIESRLEAWLKTDRCLTRNVWIHCAPIYPVAALISPICICLVQTILHF